MADCGSKFEYAMSSWTVSGAESEEEAKAMGRKKILDVIKYNNKGKCGGDCPYDYEECTFTVPVKELEAATQDTFEYDDDDEDTSYGVTTKAGTFKVTCVCVKKSAEAKKKKKHYH